MDVELLIWTFSDLNAEGSDVGRSVHLQSGRILSENLKLFEFMIVVYVRYMDSGGMPDQNVS